MHLNLLNICYIIFDFCADRLPPVSQLLGSFEEIFP